MWNMGIMNSYTMEVNLACVQLLSLAHFNLHYKYLSKFINSVCVYSDKYPFSQYLIILKNNQKANAYCFNMCWCRFA